MEIIFFFFKDRIYKQISDSKSNSGVNKVENNNSNPKTSDRMIKKK